VDKKPIFAPIIVLATASPKNQKMKKPLFLLTILCLTLTVLWLSSSNCIAQQHGFLSLSVGPAIPAGEFANGDPNSRASGLALPGGLIDLTFKKDIPHSPLGFMVSLRARMNPISASDNLAIFRAQYPDYNWSIDKHSWEAAALMVGLYHQSPLCKRAFLEEGLMVGVAEAVLPDVTVTGIKDTGANHIISDYIQAHSKKTTATTFSALFKFGGGYRLTDKLSLVAHIDFWYLEPNFGNLTQILIHAQGFNVPVNSGNFSLADASSVTYSSFTMGYAQKMNSFDLAIGLSLRL
jgi:hypothetical protein